MLFDDKPSSQVSILVYNREAMQDGQADGGWWMEDGRMGRCVRAGGRAGGVGS